MRSYRCPLPRSPKLTHCSWYAGQYHSCNSTLPKGVWSWQSGEIPADWKLANVIPIYKKGVREDPGNYRPVSLTSVPGKIMGKFTLDAIERHLKDNAIIRHSQHGFTKGKSCLPNLISFYDKVTCLVDGGKAVDVVFPGFKVRLLVLSLTASFWTSCPTVR